MGDGRCACGCGQITNVHKYGAKKGQHFRFVHGHGSKTTEFRAAARERHERRSMVGDRHPSWRGDQAGMQAIHLWLRQKHPKTGTCEECGKVGKTDYAFLRHPEPYTRDRSDYRELCRRCHYALDEPIIQRRAKAAAAKAAKEAA